MKKLLLLLLVVVVAVLVWGILKKNTPPEVAFAHVRRETLVSTLPTNGKAEPIEWQAVRAENAGLLGRVDAVEGKSVAKGTILAVLTDPTLQPAIDSARARLAEAQANLTSLEAGMKPAETAEIDSSISQARNDLEVAQRELEKSQRLVDKQAATVAEVTVWRDKIKQFQLQIDGLQKRRSAAVPQPDRDAARARITDAQVALDAATRRAALTEIRSPISGVVYGPIARTGNYVNPGDLIANVGVLDHLRVRVYVDEPELGRVALGQPVTITWQALPGKQWTGTVEKKPASIEALGSRQVGQVTCGIDNREHELIPGTNVDALIRTAVSPNALTIPKEALRHDANGDYVYALKGEILERRPVKTGNSSVTRIQIVEGLNENESIALPSDTPLKPGDRVTVAADSPK